MDFKTALISFISKSLNRKRTSSVQPVSFNYA